MIAIEFVVWLLLLWLILKEVGKAFLDVVRRAGAVNQRTVEALSDNLLTSVERDEVANLLDDLVGAAVQMRALVRGR